MGVITAAGAITLTACLLQDGSARTDEDLPDLIFCLIVFLFFPSFDFYRFSFVHLFVMLSHMYMEVKLGLTIDIEED